MLSVQFGVVQTSGKTVYFFNSELECLRTAQLSDSIIYMDFGSSEYPIFSNNSRIWYQLRSSDGGSLNSSYYESDRILENSSEGDYILFDENNTMYVLNDDGVSISHEGAAMEPWINWQASGLSMSQFDIIDILPEKEAILTVLDDKISENKKVVLLSRGEEQINKTRISAVSIDMSFAESEILNAAIHIFNRTNLEYEIELTKEYKTKITASLRDITRNQFKMDMSSKNTPDLYFFGDLLNDNTAWISSLTNLFSDLSDYTASSGMMKSFTNLYRNGSERYLLPIAVQFSTLVTPASVIKPQEPFTMDRLYQIAENMDDSDVLFGCETPHLCYLPLIESAQLDFVDRQSGTCSFDSPEYLRFLRFSESIESLCSTDYGSFEKVHLSDIYYYHAMSPNDALKNGNISFLQARFDTIRCFPALLLTFQDVPFTYCGYPTKSGSSISASSMLSVGISAAAEHKEGAQAFISTLLSDEIQTSQILKTKAFPVTRSAISAMLPIGTTYFHVSSDGRTDRIDISPVGFLHKGEKFPLDDNGNEIQIIHTHSVATTEEELEKLLTFLDTAEIKSAGNEIIENIIDEELSYVDSGVRTYEEAAKIIQSRVNLFINE